MKISPDPLPCSEKLFMHKVFKMLLEEDKINESVIENLMSRHNCGFVLMPNLRFVHQYICAPKTPMPIPLSSMWFSDATEDIRGSKGSGSALTASGLLA
ncbi:MAG: hypothetical protein RDV48_05765 [Candidatus Eremiobacteraeota bacterium]|nr:hypothetical protein [Candidatus Eremiobacteraeota bacterium]